MNDQNLDQHADLRAVREFSQARVVTSAQPLEDLRQRILTATAQQTRRTAPRPRLTLRWAIPVGAAAVVLAVVAGASLLAGRHSSAPEVATPGIPSSVLVYGKQLDVPAVFAEMEQAAVRATPIVLQPGELIYQRIDTRTRLGLPGDDSLQPELRELWIDPQGMITVQERRNGRDEIWGKGGETQAEMTADQREGFAETGPGFYYPTPAWLAGLPTDPDTLFAHIQTSAQSAWSTDDGQLGTYRSLLSELDLLLSPAHRIALYRLIARIDGLTATEVTVDGLRLYAVRYSDLNSGKDLLLDPQSGRLVGVVELSLNRFVPTALPGESQQPAPVDPVPTVWHQELWQFSTTTIIPAGTS